MNFVEMITAAYKAEQHRQDLDTEARRLKNEAMIIEDLTKMGAEDFTVKNCTVTFNSGLVLLAVFEYRHFMYQVQGVCPTCGETCWSGGRSGLVGIGEMYLDFDPSYNHRCLTKTKEVFPSNLEEQQLVAALKKFVVSIIEEGE